jgi:uncharacterized protein
VSVNNGKKALITGATSGIGAEFARRLAERGYDLIVTGRREQKIRAQAAEISEQYGVDVRVVIAELSDAADQDALADLARETKTLEFLVNNAGFGARNPFAAEPIGTHERMLGVHVLAAMKLMHAALPRMIERRKGYIVNVSSTSAFIPYPGNAMYSATKACINNLTETLHIELKRSGVRVQALCPGVTRTDFHEKLGMSPDEAYASRGPRRAMTAEEVVEASFAALAKNRPVCVPGGYNGLRTLVVRKLPRAWVHRIVLALFGGDARKAERESVEKAR